MNFLRVIGTKIPNNPATIMFKTIDIDSDYNSAHITLTQLAEAKVNTPDGKEKMNFEWLESAYLIKENKSLKFKFYFSEVINLSNVKID